MSLLILLPLAATIHGFTLVNSSEPRFSTNDVIYNIDSSGNCANAGFSNEELLNLTEESMELHWNTVPTSALNLVRGNLLPVNLLGGIDEDDDIENAFDDSNFPDQTILIGCNDQHPAFTSSSPSIGLAVTIGDKAMVLINSVSGTDVADLSRMELLALIAHEVGHGVGLGHSNYSTALMYFNIAGEGYKLQERLSQDDYDGVTYLYPHKNLFTSCGSIGVKSPPEGNLLSLLAGFCLILLLFGLSKTFNQRAEKKRNFFSR